MKRKKASKINPKNTKKSSVKLDKVDEYFPSFHESFPLTLIFKEDKEKKVCYFQCKEHLDSYIKRYKLKKSSISIEKTKKREENI